MTTEIRHRYTTAKLLLLLLLTMAGVNGAWAVDDTFTVTAVTPTTLGATIYSGTYTSLTLSATGNEENFAYTNAEDNSSDVNERGIWGNQSPKSNGNGSFDGNTNLPTTGSYFKITTSKPGEFVIRIKLDVNKRVFFRSSSGDNIATRKNTSGSSAKYNWTITVDAAGDYYLFIEGGNLRLFSYTFTRKVPTGITSIPYHADFSRDVEPFDDGTKINGTNVSNLFTINSVSPNSGTAIARFNGVHTLASTEQVTLSFTAYHGYYNKGGTSKVTLYNSDDRPLISYTYNKQTCYITEVSFDGVQAEGFAEFNARSNTGGHGANGLASANYPFSNNAADNPVVTMTFLGTGQATFNITRTYGSLNTTYNAALTTVKKDLAYIKIEDTSDNDDRGLGIDNLSITSQLASLDYETEVVDWTTSVDNYFTPVVLEEASNHYLSVNQSQRYYTSSGVNVTTTYLRGSVPAGQAYTISFDMKLGNAYSSNEPSFTIKDANNSGTPVFLMTASAPATGHSEASTTWTINGSENVTLTGSGPTIDEGDDIEDLTWYHYTISHSNGYTYVTIDSKDGSTHYFRKGIANSSGGGIGDLVFYSGRVNGNFAIDNIQVVPYASTSFTQDGKVETYTIMGEGDLPQVEEGKTIKIEYGVANEVQKTELLTGTTTYGSYAIDTNTGGVYPQAYGTGSSMIGTFYKLTPKYDGKLTITGWVNVVNNITITNASGTVIDDWKSAGITANALFTHEFTTVLSAGTDYYLYGCAPNTVNTGSANGGTDNYAILHLTGFTFTQSAMNRQVTVADLLYAGEKSGDNLARTIPGFSLSFSDKVESNNNCDYLKFSNTGTMTITLRQNGYDAQISDVTLMDGTSKIASGEETYIVATSYSDETKVATATITAKKDDLYASSFIVSYNASDASSYKLWLNEDKAELGEYGFSTTHIMRVPGDGQTFTNSTLTFTESEKYWTDNFTYSSSNTNIATINTNGTGGLLKSAGEATITATFEETDYFKSRSASYTVDNVLLNGETYTITGVTSGQKIRIGANATADNTNLTLTGAVSASMTFGTTATKHQAIATSTAKAVLYNSTSSPITINSVSVYTSNLKAYLYYEGQEGNYAMQLHFQGFASGDVKGFRVLDIGNIDDPVDLTSAYQLSDGNYVLTGGNPVILEKFGGTFNASTGSFTVSSEQSISGAIVFLPKITHELTMKESVEGYSNNELTEPATANIYIAELLDVDSDGDKDTYKKWDMTASVTSSGQMESRWTWNGHGFYQASLPEYLPILNNSGTTLTGNEGLQASGDLRYHVGTNGLRMNLTTVNSRLKFPVKAGMEVKIEMSSASADIEHIITNVTDIAGEATNKLYIERADIANATTAYYLAEADGAIELLSMDKTGGYVKSITLQVPQIHFKEEIVTVAATDANITNIPYNTGTATLTYSIAGEYDLPATYDGDGTSVSTGTVASNINSSNGTVSVTGREGYAIINVTNSSATGVQPKKGSYRLYVIDFKYNPESAALSDLSASQTEVTYTDRPTGYDKVVQPVEYSISFGKSSSRGHLTQDTKSNPRETTFNLTAYSKGTIYLTAKTGRISTTRTLTVGGYAFKEVAPVITLEELAAANYIYENEFPDGFTPTSVKVDMSGDAYCHSGEIVDSKIKLTLRGGDPVRTTGGGALRVNATDASSNTIHFVLTIPYTASSKQKWDFYRMKNYDSGSKYGMKIGKIDDYDGDVNQVKEDFTITGTNTWTTEGTNWNKVYRKGTEQERWAYRAAVKGDNAFIVEETAGLIIETGQKGFYIDNPHQPSEEAYNHIGLHNNATVTIPRLKKGDYIALNLCRVIPNNGAILSATNVVDLAGNSVDHQFTISRSQTDYKENGEPATYKSGEDYEGARFIPGYYTFQAAADGDVSFTLEDEGYLDILSIEIYDGDYASTMRSIVVDEAPYTTAPPVYVLKEDNETCEVNLPICNYLWSTSVGPADYEVVDQKGDLNATLENIEWVSGGGALYNKGNITAKEGYGNITVRMNNYTAEGRYLIGYTPTYTLTVGHKPHQDYPYTWNFTNISGGAVKGRGNNVYNSISSDYLTWTNLGYETYQLDTRTSGGSLYVPGATLVTADRDLGRKGTIAELNAANLGCDEFNGLGFTGKIAFKLAQQGAEANDAPTDDWNQGVAKQLLLYDFIYAAESTEDNAYNEQKTVVDATTTWTSKELDAGDGKITFGNPSKRETPGDGITLGYTSAHFVYKMDGGNTKNALLKPQRPLKEGDVITLHGYSTASVQLSGFSFYAGANDNAYDALLTLNWPSSTATAEQEIVYTVKQGDGLAGRSEVYLCRAGKQYTVYLTEVKITGDDASAPTSYERAITCQENVTVTIPDLKAGHYVYIKSSAAPTSNTNLNAAVDGLDATTNVNKYVVAADGNANVTFASDTKIYRIGVTNIMKQLKRVGEGDAWATESRDHAIDYTQTGQFTVNDIKANTVTAKSYTGNKVTVRLNEKTDAMPAETGMVLKLVYDAEKFNKTKNYNSGTATGEVPLFYPPYSTTILNSGAVGFDGTEGNLMKANLTEQLLDSETETISTTEFVRFIFADRYMKWTKIDNSVQHTEFTNSGNVPVFYRLHLYNGTEADALSSTEATLNTLGANKAYMLIRSGNVPDALWKTPAPSPAPKHFIGIEGISDMEDIQTVTNETQGDGRTYNLKGQVVSDEGSLSPGIYIRNGKKIVVK